MAESEKPGADSPSASDSHSHGSQQETILLTDLPGLPHTPEESEPARAADAPAQPHDDLSPSVLAVLRRRYDVLGEAGHGSMGNVYKARDRETGETVALKILKPEIASDQAMMDRFKNELLFARKITHKNVCRVYEFNRVGGVAYTSMEFVEGESLRSVLNRFGGLPFRKAVDLGLQICSGLKEAHAQGIVHRDLKPENVMIDTQGNVKIMDFGIARSMEAGTRLTGSMVGTPAYMAPEQVAGKSVDYRTDIYSLGLILYEILTGTQAFRAENSVALALKQLRESPAPLREIEPMIPQPLERAVMKCLEKDPARRFQSIQELEKVLRPPKPSAAAARPLIEPMPAPASALQPNLDAPISPLSAAPAFGSLGGTPEPRRTSIGAWIFLLAFLGLGAWATLHAQTVWDLAQKLRAEVSGKSFSSGAVAPSPAADENAAPTSAPAPQPPASASTAPATSGAAASAPASPAPTSSSADATQQAAAKPAPPAKQPASGSVPKSVRQRADKAFASPDVSGEAGAAYLWCGRFEQEDRAQEAARKIYDLGLPVEVIPRHNAAGDFYVVVSGPFGQNRLSSVTDWLENQGFSDVHPIRYPLAARRGQQ